MLNPFYIIHIGLNRPPQRRAKPGCQRRKEYASLITIWQCCTNLTTFSGFGLKNVFGTFHRTQNKVGSPEGAHIALDSINRGSFSFEKGI